MKPRRQLRRAPPAPTAVAPPTAPAVGASAETTAIPAVAKAEAAPAPSWFARAPLAVGVGEGDQRWNLTFYGFVEAEYITDSTRSYGDAIGSGLVARSDTYEGKVGRSQFSMRNTRLGLKFDSPTAFGVKPSAVLEGDFFGASSISASSENNVYTSPTFRVRHAYLSLPKTTTSTSWPGKPTTCSVGRTTSSPCRSSSSACPIRSFRAINSFGSRTASVAPVH